MALIRSLDPFVRAHDRGELLPGPVDVIFAEGDYLEPDLIFLRRGRDEIVTDRGVEGPPDLVVEIISPSTAARDRGIKRDRYRLHGVPEYWVSGLRDGRRRQEPRRLTDSATRETMPALSPDGDWAVFPADWADSRKGSFAHKLWLQRVDGSEGRLLEPGRSGRSRCDPRDR